MANKEGTKKRKAIWLRVLLGLGLGMALLFVSAYLLLFHLFYSFADLPLLLRPLPSDEQMIANFHQHRADFERLVQIYREDLSIPTDFILLQPTPQIKDLMARINVDSVEGDGMVWMPPDPYSTDPTFLERKYSFDHLPQRRNFSGVKLGYAYGTVITYHLGLISKNYYYIPLVPRVSDGQLVLTASPAGGLPHVAETLNNYPSKFGLLECFCKQIEPHWFIEMCRIQ
jgi:hypothetical protein